MRGFALSAISCAMAESENPRFNLRLTPELEAHMIQSSKKHGRSKNAEILAALEWRYSGNAALVLAEALEPLLENLTDEQRENLVEIIRAMASGKAARKRYGEKPRK